MLSSFSTKGQIVYLKPVSLSSGGVIITDTDKVDVIIRTFNSSRTLENCLNSVIEHVPFLHIFLIDHGSTDHTLEIASHFPVKVIDERIGLGYATTLGISLARTNLILFVDSDVTIVKRNFFQESRSKIESGKTAAVVGGSSGYPFLFGLPLGLTLFRRDVVDGVFIPPEIQSRETYFLARALKRGKWKTRYVSEAMIHNSPYRSYRNWPEWQGAHVRITAGLKLSELLSSFLTIFLMLSNSRSPRNVAYFPFFIAKFMRGFLNPERWNKLDRSRLSV